MSLGGGGGGGTTTQVQKADPWVGQQPYLTNLYQAAQRQFEAGPQQFYPGRTYAEVSPTTLQAEELQRQAALGQQMAIAGSLVPAFQQQLMSPAQRFADPFLQQSLAAGLRPYEESASRLLQQARRGATQAGQLGGTRQAILESEVIGDYLTKASDVASKLYGDVYGQALEAQTRGLGLAPSIMGTFAQPAQTLAQIGAAETARAQQPITEAMQRFAFEQAAPGQALQQYGNIVAGTILPGTVTASGTQPGMSPLAGALGGGLAGGALGASSLGTTLGLTGPIGALGGAILGGLLT